MDIIDRHHLLDNDLNFLVKAVVTKRTDHEHVKEIIRDKPDLIDIMLDDPKLSAKIMDDQEALLQISPYFLFSVLLRQVRRDLQKRSFTLELLGTAERVAIFDAPKVSSLLDNRELREYLVELLTSFTRTNSWVLFYKVGAKWKRRRFSDMDVDDLLLLSEMVEPEHRFPLYRRLGDLSLFLTGVFPEAVVRRPVGYLARRRPGHKRSLEEYLEIGPQFYQRAASCPEASQAQLEGVFTTLSKDFALARKPLTILSQKYIKFDRYRWFSLN